MKLVKSEKGMSLIEVIISLAILGIVSSGIIIFFTDSFKFQARIQEVSKAQKVADAVMEDIKNGIRDFNGGTEVFDNTEYEFEVSKTNGIKSGNAVVGGIELYYVTVKARPTRNKSIVGEASSTIRKQIDKVDENNYCTIDYMVKDKLETSETVYIVEDYDYYIIPYVPWDGFSGWKDKKTGTVYMYGQNATITITNDSLPKIITLEAQ